MTGATGLVGSALSRALVRDGDEVVPIARRPPHGTGGVAWDPERGMLDSAHLDATDAVVHLAGESIAGGRWNEARKRRIRESRIQGTSLLVRTLAGLKKPPAVLVSASAVGYYGDRGDQRLTEDCAAGRGFLAEVCVDWEAEAARAADSGIRVVMPRIGVVLAAGGGALARMLLPFRLGLGGRIGDGRQYWSWVSLADLVALIRFAIRCPALSGPVNAGAPNPVTNSEFAGALARVLRRPAVLPVPGFAVRLALGEMADSLLLYSARMAADRAEAAGFRFSDADVEKALRKILGP